MNSLSSKLARILIIGAFAHVFFFPQKSHAQTDSAQKEVAKPTSASFLIRWDGKPGVERYRLQIATDPGFNDIVFDQAVVGRERSVEGLTPGKYYWRVAPAAKETGAFSPPTKIEVTTTRVAEVASVIKSSETGGWRTATGEVARPIPARLRAGGVVDFVGVNQEGTIYAIDGASGVALWTARYRPGAREKAAGTVPHFDPVLIQRQDIAASVVVAFEGGVRALKGDTGREAWRASLEGRPASGTAGDMNADGAPEVVVVTLEPNRIHVLDGGTGRVLAEKSLDAAVVGAPLPFSFGDTRGVVLGLENGAVEIRAHDASIVRNVKLSSEATTAPLVVRSGTLAMIVIGSREGLMALSFDDLKTLGRIVPEGDVVRGTLSAEDVDNDGTPEIILLTKRGRVALVSTIDGNVKWYAQGASDAAASAFADVNADGVLDVIVPGGDVFAVGYSGRDGSLIWKVEEPGAKAQTGNPAARARSLVIAPWLNGGAIVVGSDPSRTGLRAVELPAGAVKTASR